MYVLHWRCNFPIHPPVQDRPGWGSVIFSQRQGNYTSNAPIGALGLLNPLRRMVINVIPMFTPTYEY